jgi:uncharacterized protein
MFLSINDMRAGKVRFGETFAPGVIDFFDQQLRQTEPILSNGVAELTEATLEVRVSGHVATSMEIACDRCLEPTVLPLQADFSLLYRPAFLTPEQEEMAVAASESEVGFYEGDGLDLADVLREEILLLLPMHRVCREDCKGICPVCGQNRNQVDCHCHQELADDRWAALRKL